MGGWTHLLGRMVGEGLHVSLSLKCCPLPHTQEPLVSVLKLSDVLLEP